MRILQLVDEREVVRVPRVRLAERFLARLLGLLLAPRLQAGEGLLLRPCRGVHTFGMRYRIDVVHLDRHLRVRAIRRDVPPFRLVPGPRSACCVLELPAGGADQAGLRVGERLRLAEPPDARVASTLRRWLQPGGDAPGHARTPAEEEA